MACKETGRGEERTGDYFLPTTGSVLDGVSRLQLQESSYLILRVGVGSNLECARRRADPAHLAAIRQDG